MTSAASVQCVVRTSKSQTRTRLAVAPIIASCHPARKLLLDFRLDHREGLGVVIDFNLLASLVVAVDFIAIAIDFELLDLVALRLDTRTRLGFGKPFGLGIGGTIGAGHGGGCGGCEGKGGKGFWHEFFLEGWVLGLLWQPFLL